MIITHNVTHRLGIISSVEICTQRSHVFFSNYLLSGIGYLAHFDMCSYCIIHIIFILDDFLFLMCLANFLTFLKEL